MAYDGCGVPGEHRRMDPSADEAEAEAGSGRVGAGEEDRRYHSLDCHPGARAEGSRLLRRILRGVGRSRSTQGGSMTYQTATNADRLYHADMAERASTDDLRRMVAPRYLAGDVHGRLAFEAARNELERREATKGKG